MDLMNQLLALRSFFLRKAREARYEGRKNDAYRAECRASYYDGLLGSALDYGGK